MYVTKKQLIFGFTPSYESIFIYVSLCFISTNSFCVNESTFYLTQVKFITEARIPRYTYLYEKLYVNKQNEK